jgi:hypothetical protein
METTKTGRKYPAHSTKTAGTAPIEPYRAIALCLTTL